MSMDASRTEAVRQACGEAPDSQSLIADLQAWEDCAYRVAAAQCNQDPTAVPRSVTECVKKRGFEILVWSNSPGDFDPADSPEREWPR